MSQRDMEKRLREMTLSQKAYPVSYATDVANVIIRYYCVTERFYEEDAIKTFSLFISKGILSLKGKRYSPIMG